MKRLISWAAIVLIATTATFADIAPEPGKKSKSVKKPPIVSTTLEISLDSRAEEARLIIPASQLKQLRAELEQLDNEGDHTAALTIETTTFTKTQTIVSGVFLSLAFLLGGIWFARSGRSGKMVGAVVSAAAFGSAATVIYANIGPPPSVRNITGEMFSQTMHRYGSGWGKIKLETGGDDRVRLIVPNPTPETKTVGEE